MSSRPDWATQCYTVRSNIKIKENIQGPLTSQKPHEKRGGALGVITSLVEALEQ